MRSHAAAVLRKWISILPSSCLKPASGDGNDAALSLYDEMLSEMITIFNQWVHGSKPPRLESFAA